jgi:hypothetical protein
VCQDIQDLRRRLEALHKAAEAQQAIIPADPATNTLKWLLLIPEAFVCRDIQDLRRQLEALHKEVETKTSQEAEAQQAIIPAEPATNTLRAHPHFADASSRTTAPAAVPTTQSTRSPDLAATDSVWPAVAGDGAAEKAAAEKSPADKAAGGVGGKQSAVLASSPPPLVRVEEMKPTSPVTSKGVGGVGMIVEEEGMSRGVKVLRVKSLSPGAPAISCGMIAPGDCLITVDGKKVTSVDEAVKAILGEIGSPITMQFERDGKSFVVDLRRGKAASLE